MISALWQMLFPSEYYASLRREPSAMAAALSFITGIAGWMFWIVSGIVWDWYQDPPMGMGKGNLPASFRISLAIHRRLLIREFAYLLVAAITLTFLVLLIVLRWGRVREGLGRDWRIVRQALKFILVDACGLIWLVGLVAVLLRFAIRFQRAGLPLARTGCHLLVIALPLVWLVLLAWIVVKAVVRLQDQQSCLSCGYLLINLPESTRRCPECGEVFDPQRIRKAKLQAEERP